MYELQMFNVEVSFLMSFYANSTVQILQNDIIDEWQLTQRK